MNCLRAVSLLSPEGFFPKKRKEVFDFLKSQVQKGRQAYVVYPLVEESENFDLKNAMDQYEKLKSYYKDLKWGLLTGRMSPEEKQGTMDRFVKGEIQGHGFHHSD